MKDQCDGKCNTCDERQRSYCTVQMLYNMQGAIAELVKELREREDNSVRIAAPSVEQIKLNENEL